MEAYTRLIKGGLAVDDRGSVKFVNDFDFTNINRFYQVENHRRGYIRAWHGHEREGKYIWVCAGSALVGATPIKSKPGDLASVTKVTLSAQTPSVYWIPAGYYNGFMNLVENTILIFFSTSKLEDSEGDDIRQPYDMWNIWQDDYR